MAAKRAMCRLLTRLCCLYGLMHICQRTDWMRTSAVMFTVSQLAWTWWGMQAAHYKAYLHVGSCLLIFESVNSPCLLVNPENIALSSYCPMIARLPVCLLEAALELVRIENHTALLYAASICVWSGQSGSRSTCNVDHSCRDPATLLQS